MSDQDPSIFDSATPTSNATPVEEPKSTTVDYSTVLKQIVDSDGRQKYESVDKALEALPHAQSHISKLEAEMEELRAKLSQSDAAEKLLAQVKAGKESTDSPTLDPNELVKLVEGVLDSKEQTKVKAQNKTFVGDAMIEYYGDKSKAEEAFNAKSRELGINLVELSATSPAAALELLGIKKQVNRTPGKTTSNINSENLPDINNKREIKPVMGATSTRELLDTWRACAPTQE